MCLKLPATETWLVSCLLPDIHIHDVNLRQLLSWEAHVHNANRHKYFAAAVPPSTYKHTSNLLSTNFVMRSSCSLCYQPQILAGVEIYTYLKSTFGTFCHEKRMFITLPATDTLPLPCLPAAWSPPSTNFVMRMSLCYQPQCFSACQAPHVLFL